MRKREIFPTFAVVSLIVLLISLPGAASSFDPLLPDFRVDQGFGHAHSFSPASAFSASHNFFIVVWRDGRNYDSKIFGRRLDSDGIPLGPDFRIDQSPAGDCNDPAAAFDRNGNFIVVWDDNRSGDYDIYARRFDAEGVPLGDDFRVDQGVGAQWAAHPSVSCASNNHCAIVWTGSIVSGRIYDENGAPLGNEFAVRQVTTSASNPVVAVSGNDVFMAAWDDYRSTRKYIYAQRYDINMVPLAPEFRVDQAPSYNWCEHPSVGADGNNNFIVAWSDSRSGPYHIYARRFESSGGSLGNENIIDQAGAGYWSLRPSVVANSGSGFMVGWFRERDTGDYYHVFGRGFDPFGVALGPEFQIDQASQQSEAISAAADAAGNYLVSYTGTGVTVFHVHAGKYDSAGGALGGAVVVDEAFTDGSAGFSAVTTDSEDRFIAAWVDQRNEATDIYIRWFDEFGNALSDDRRVDQGPPGTSSTGPRLATHDDDVTAVVWSDERNGRSEIFARLLIVDGNTLGDDFHLNPDLGGTYSAYSPSLALTPSHDMIVSWNDYRDDQYHIFARRYNRWGAPLGPDFRVDQSGGLNDFDCSSAIIIDAENNFIIAWGDDRDGSTQAVYARRFGPTGTPLGNEFQVSQGVPSTVQVGGIKAARFRDGNFLIIWADGRAGQWQVFARLYNSVGSPLGDDFRVDQSVSGLDQPAIAITSEDVAVIAWSEYNGANTDLYARRLNSSGAALGDAFRIDQSSRWSDCPSLAASPNGNVVLAWRDYQGMDQQLAAAVWGPDTDGDGIGDAWDNCAATVNPAQENWDGDEMGDACDPDDDNDGLEDADETIQGSNPLDPDSDDDGIEDGEEVHTWLTSPVAWDTDGDHLGDGFEVLHGASLHPLDPSDGALDPDGDTNPTAHEYYNKSDPWSPDPVPPFGFDIGCYYWGKGDGGPYVQPSDITKIQMAYVGAPVDYSQVLPSAFDPLDLDRSTVPDPADITLAQYMYIEADRPGGYASSPAALSVESAPGSAVAVGDTTHVTVSVHAQGPGTELYSPGFGVVFWVTSGNAVLLGGEGTDPDEAAGNRYDVSMDAASGALANIVVLVTGPGPVTVNAKVPACGVEPIGRWCAEVLLGAPAVINP